MRKLKAMSAICCLEVTLSLFYALNAKSASYPTTAWQSLFVSWLFTLECDFLVQKVAMKAVG